MCLHYLVKLIARVLLPYITYLSIQVVDFRHQIFTNCWNNSVRQLTTVSVVFPDIHYIFFAVMTSMWRVFWQVCRLQNNNATELTRRSSCWKKSRLIADCILCVHPVQLSSQLFHVCLVRLLTVSLICHCYVLCVKSVRVFWLFCYFDVLSVLLIDMTQLCCYGDRNLWSYETRSLAQLWLLKRLFGFVCRM